MKVEGRKKILATILSVYGQLLMFSVKVSIHTFIKVKDLAISNEILYFQRSTFN